MIKRVWKSVLLVVLTCVLVAGCSSAGERGKNRNLDRPVAGK